MKDAHFVLCIDTAHCDILIDGKTYPHSAIFDMAMFDSGPWTIETRRPATAEPNRPVPGMWILRNYRDGNIRDGGTLWKPSIITWDGDHLDITGDTP